MAVAHWQPQGQQETTEVLDYLVMLAMASIAELLQPQSLFPGQVEASSLAVPEPGRSQADHPKKRQTSESPWAMAKAVDAALAETPDAKAALVSPGLLQPPVMRRSQLAQSPRRKAAPQSQEVVSNLAPHWLQHQVVVEEAENPAAQEFDCQEALTGDDWRHALFLPEWCAA